MTESLKYDASFRLVKTPTGIDGFDDISGGGLPSGRTTVVMGPTGAGKTVFSLEFLARGALQFGEPGVLITFEESEGEILANSASFGIYIAELVSGGKLFIDHLDVDPYEITETGRYDLIGLQLRIGHAVDSIGARRIVLDGVPALFYGFTDTSMVRNALSRLYRWLKSRELTTVITAESQTELSRNGLGLSLCDCIVEITAKSGTEGKLFGSVGNIDIAAVISDAGIEVEKREVRLPEGPIRVAGEYEIVLHLHSDVDAVARITVIADENA